MSQTGGVVGPLEDVFQWLTVEKLLLKKTTLSLEFQTDKAS